MRYLIIDSQDCAVPREGIYGRVLSEEETIAKFKKVFDRGLVIGSRDWTREKEGVYWDELKKQL